jgi:hypothetical protein
VPGKETEIGDFAVTFGQIQRDLSEIAEFGLDDIAIIVLDYDPDVHGPAVAEALAQWLSPRPLIFVSSDESLQRPLRFGGRSGQASHQTGDVRAARTCHRNDCICL